MDKILNYVILEMLDILTNLELLFEEQFNI